MYLSDYSKDWQKNDFFPGSLVDPVHLSNSGHVLVAKYLSGALFLFVKDRCTEITAANSVPFSMPISKFALSSRW